MNRLELSELPGRSKKVGARSRRIKGCHTGFPGAVGVVGTTQQAGREGRQTESGCEVLHPDISIGELTVDIGSTWDGRARMTSCGKDIPDVRKTVSERIDRVD